MTDPVMNPPAPSGRRDDSSLTSDGERIALPAGTRLYVDAGGAKHYIQPDGIARYVPPGEVGNFYLEGENPRDAVRRHLVQELPYVDAVRVGNVVDGLFDALDDARMIGADLKLVPANPEDNKALGDVLDRSYQAQPSQQYPKWKYHPDDGGKIVANEDEEGNLGHGWHDDPDKAKAARSGDKQSFEPTFEPMAERRAEAAAKNDGRFVDDAGFTDTGGVLKPDVAPGDKPAPVA